MALYREDLEGLGRCSLPGCTKDHRDEEIYFHAQCHIDSACWVHYRGDVLTIECARCGKPIVAVVVASRAQERRGFDPLDDEAVP